MDKYKINYIFSIDQDINDIFIKVLNKEIKKYEGPSLTHLPLDGGRNY